MKNIEEDMVFEYLKKLYGNSVLPGPNPNLPPDIYITPSLGVEVTRLNQHYFESGEPEGLENLEISFYKAFIGVLRSLNSITISKKSYYVYPQFRRTVNYDLHQVKRDMKRALTNFLDTKITNLPYYVSINPEISFSLYERQSNDGKVFVSAGSYDDDAGGEEILVYAQNIRYCITKKSSKVSTQLDKYNEWWLYLVDRIGYALDKNGISRVGEIVGNTGKFDKLFLLGADGQNVIMTMSKQ